MEYEIFTVVSGNVASDILYIDITSLQVSHRCTLSHTSV